MLNHVWQTILQECEAQLTRKCKAPVSDTERLEAIAAMPPSRGRRVLVGAIDSSGAGLLLFSFPESICRVIVCQATGQEAIDCSDQDFNDAILGFCVRVLKDVGQTGPAQSAGFTVTPPLVLRSTTSVVGPANALCDARQLVTERGAVTVMSINTDPRASADDDSSPRAQAVTVAVTTSKQRHAAEPPRILIVDDDPQSCRLLATGLRDNGWGADVAHRGQSALSYLGRNQPDLILLDYDMPGMDGLECLQAIREKHGPIPVIMVTAAKSPDVIKRAKALGAVDYIIKPYKIEHVNNRIQRVLEDEPSVVG